MNSDLHEAARPRTSGDALHDKRASAARNATAHSAAPGDATGSKPAAKAPATKTAAKAETVAGDTHAAPASGGNAKLGAKATVAKSAPTKSEGAASDGAKGAPAKAGSPQTAPAKGNAGKTAATAALDNAGMAPRSTAKTAAPAAAQPSAETVSQASSAAKSAAATGSRGETAHKSVIKTEAAAKPAQETAVSGDKPGWKPSAQERRVTTTAQPVTGMAETIEPIRAMEAETPVPTVNIATTSTPAPATEVAEAPPPPPRTAETRPMPGSRPMGGPNGRPTIAPRAHAKVEQFVVGDHVVYPTHGVGKVERITTEEIAGHKLELIHITFEENRMTLRVPVSKAPSSGLRKLATRTMFDEALAILKGRARIKRTMWSRRAQEYEAKINSGDPLAIAEVVRDLHRNAGQPDQSFSERQIYEAAMDRLAAELAALDQTDKLTASTKLADYLKTIA